MQENNQTKRLICFLHIEKAAGTTVHEILRNNYWNYYWESPYIYNLIDTSQAHHLNSQELFSIGTKIPFFKAFGGHSIRLWEDYGQLFGQDVFYFTFFRDPIKRYLSNFFFQKYNMSIERTFEEYLSDSYFHNFMTKKICGKTDYEYAVQMLNRHNVFIGFVEDFDASLHLLKRELYAFDEDIDIKYEKRNVNKNKDATELHNLLDIYKDKIYENNELDCRLYNHFLKRFQSKHKNQINVHNLTKSQKENVDYKFSRARRKLQHKLKRLYFQKLEKIYRDQSKRKLLI